MDLKTKKRAAKSAEVEQIERKMNKIIEILREMDVRLSAIESDVANMNAPNRPPKPRQLEKTPAFDSGNYLLPKPLYEQVDIPPMLPQRRTLSPPLEKKKFRY